MTCSVVQKKILCLYKYRHLELKFDSCTYAEVTRALQTRKAGNWISLYFEKVLYITYMLYEYIQYCIGAPNYLAQVGIFLLKTVFVISRKKIQDDPRPRFMQEDRLNTALKCCCLVAFKSVNHQSEILFNWLRSLQGRTWGFSLYYLNTDTVQKLSIMFIWMSAKYFIVYWYIPVKG